MNKEVSTSQKKGKKKSHPFWQFFWLTFLVVSLAYAWYSFYAPSNEIKWVKNITTIQELTNNSASNSSKNTMLFFTGQWCSPCRIMKREVFADSEVEKMVNAQIIPVIIDIDNPSTKEIVKYYKVGATPTTIIVNSQGNVLEFVVGKVEKSKFIEMLRNTESNK